MYRVFLIAVLLLKCDFLFGQEVGDKVNRSRVGEAGTFGQSSFNNQANDFSVSVINGATARSGPCAFINNQLLVCRGVGGDVSFRCNWDVKAKRKTCECDWRAVRVVGDTAERERAQYLIDRAVFKRILQRQTGGYDSFPIELDRKSVV